MTLKRCLRLACGGFVVIAVAACGYCAAVWFNAWLYQRNQTRRFDDELKLKNRAAVQDPIPPAAAAPQAGGLVAKLEIARIGVSVAVVEGVAATDLEHAIGHVPGTALPGNHGNVAIAGHRDTYFRPLARIHRGDTMTMETLRGTYRYQVISTETVQPENVAVLYPTARDTLTLITCYPFHYIGSAPKRFIVRAVRLPATS